MWVRRTGKQEYSSRTLGATWGIISAVMVPIVIVLICIGWRILKRRKAEEKEENDYFNASTVKSRPIDPEESMRINSDDESIPYKKDVTEDSPEPTDAVKVVNNSNDNENPAYGLPFQPYDDQARAYDPTKPENYGFKPQTQPYDPIQMQTFGQAEPQAYSPTQPQAYSPTQPEAYSPVPQTYDANQTRPQPGQSRAWAGETEIN